MSSSIRLALFAALSAALPSAPARSQDVLLDVTPPVSGSLACYAAGIGDVDGDGIDDLAVGALLDDTVAKDAGALRFCSGKDGSVLATLYGTTASEHFGVPVVRVPDLDGDGVDDVAFGASGASNSGPATGSVFVVSGRTTATLLQIDGPANGYQFGGTLGVIGDVDGDRVSDLVIGHGGYGDTVHVHSGFDGHEITSILGIPQDGFGYSVSVLDDLDADGVRDLLISAPYHRNAQGQMVGAVFVISTVTGAVLRTHDGVVGSGLYYGAATASISDHDGDGAGDYVFSDIDPAASELVYRVFSGATGAGITKISSADQLWSSTGSIADAGDVNGDGVGDLCIGNGWDDSLGRFHGAAYIVSGKTWLHLDRIEPGGEVLPVPFVDFDRNGCVDLLIGVADTPALDGRVCVYSGAPLWLNATPSEVVAGDRLALATREGVPGALTIVALEEVDGVPTFQIVDGLATFGSQGGRRIVEQVPAGLAGHDLTFRSYTHDLAGRLIRSAGQLVQLR